MSVKVRLGEIRIILEGLKKLVNKELPVKTAYNLTKIMKVVSDEFTSLEEARTKLVKKYAEEPKKEGKEPRQGEIKVDPKKQNEFFKEFSTLLEKEVTMGLETISIEDLGDITLTPADMIGLQKILKEEKR